jgi:hypothetical protein
MATLNTDMLLRITGKSLHGNAFCNYFVPKHDILNHTEKDGKTISLTYFKQNYTCNGMFKKGFTIEHVTLVNEFIQSFPVTLSGLTTEDFDC